KFNRTPALCNAKILIWDLENERFEGAVGSYNWLADHSWSNQQDAPIHCTVRLHHPAILSALAWCAAGLWSRSRSEYLASVPDRWRRIANDLDEKVGDLYDDDVLLDDRPRVRVIRDHEHATLIGEWAASTQDRLLISSS